MEPTTFRGQASENAHKMIFIADLPRSTAYLDLSDFYEKHIGPCQICIKRPLFKAFYYAFVMFDTIENAKKAVEEHRYPRIKGGLMCRALPYNLHAIRGEPGGKDVQSTSIFIRGFETTKWSHEDLYVKFCAFGKILSCKVSVDAEHRFLGFGYIQYSKIEEAQKAIKEMDKYDLASEGDGAEGTLTVLEYQAKKPVVHKKTFNNVYVKGFPKDDSFNEENLTELFVEFGEIQNVAIMRDGTGTSKGFGFVCFTEGPAAEKATQYVLRNDPTALGDKEDAPQIKQVKGIKLTDLYVREAKKKGQRVQELQMNNFKYKKSIMFFSLFVKNFPLGTTEEELRIYFSTACQGEVTKVMVVPGTQQAFVNFEKQDQCKTAKEFARNVLFKSQYALYVEYCYPKEMRQIRNEELHDKRAQERKRNQQNQAQIASLNGSQNLIDLLTLLLKPAFQFNQNLSSQQRRSQSLNSMGGRHGGPGGRGDGMMSNGGGAMPHQMNNYQQQPRYVNNRSNFQGPNHRNAHHQHPRDSNGFMHNQQMMNRNNSMNNTMSSNGQPPHQQMAPPPSILNQNQMGQMPVQPTGQGHLNAQQQQQAILNQSMSQVSMGTGSVASSTAPQYADMQYAKAYFDEIQAMFVSPDFKTAKRREKKEMVGNAIYKHVEKLVGDQRAPKITGMLIDLPEAELNYSISQWVHFEQKVMSALQLITQSAQDPNQAPQQDPSNQAPAGASSAQESKAEGVAAP